MQVQCRHSLRSVGLWLLVVALSLITSQTLLAATLCVNPQGSGGCQSSISAAVAAASPGDTILVASGTYTEDVVIPKSLSLVGEGWQNTTIDATGLDNGINVDGYHNPGLADVVVTGFTVENANFAGVLVTNATAVTIADNRVQDNDKALNTSNFTCPGLPPQFQAGEDGDCGEGVMFSAVDHSTLAKNIVTANSGGMLITDDTGPTHHNLVTGNRVVHNTQFDCGITLPSHSGAGVYRNTVAGNDSSYNGGPGVGIFAPGPGTKAFANVVINNRLVGNGLPGVTMHNHAAPGVGHVPPQAPPVDFSNNVIVGNFISRNAADGEDAATSGPTGINLFSLAPVPGTIIEQNFIDQEDLDVVIHVPSGLTQVHLNNFPNHKVGVQNKGTAPVDATLNWWGCSGGPGAPGCATVSITGTGAVQWAPWLRAPFSSPENEH